MRQRSTSTTNKQVHNSKFSTISKKSAKEIKPWKESTMKVPKKDKVNHAPQVPKKKYVSCFQST